MRSWYTILHLLYYHFSRQVSFTKSLVLITEELVHPTIAGMPLRMGIHGAATAHVQLTGHMDLRSAFNSPHNIDITGNIKPRWLII